MENKFIDSHFLDGGTGVTNFEMKELPIYEEACKLFGNPLVKVGPPIRPLAHRPQDYRALHVFWGTGDLSAFWRIFERLECESSKERGLEDADPC